MKEQVMVYEVKSKAVENSKILLTKDCFYWNDLKFQYLNNNDYIFVVNSHEKYVLFTRFKSKRIQADQNQQTLTATFSENNFVYKPKASSLNKLSEWSQFVKLEVILKLITPIDWKWKSLGNSETTYLNGIRVDSSNSNRKLNIDQLKVLSQEETYTKVLDSCITNFLLDKVKQENIPTQTKPKGSSQMNIIPDFEEHLKTLGLVYNQRLIKRFISSLATKPFVILTGNSGSGKSRIAVEFAKWMNSSEKQVNEKEYVKGQLLLNNEGFIWKVENTYIKWGKIDLPKKFASLFFNLFEFKGADNIEIVTDSEDHYNARYTIYEGYPIVYAYKEFSSWLEKIGVGNYFKIEIQNTDNPKAKLKLKVSGLKKDTKVQEENKEPINRYALVPVGADWTDNRSVIGYINPLTKVTTYITTPILELLLRANMDLGNPYFLILDEMNLSHVERYFSDFLSLIESPDQPLKLHDSIDSLFSMGNESIQIPPQIDKFPPNLFVIGTVNIDETTYMFSPKVLDRANVIEIKNSYDDLAAFSLQSINIKNEERAQSENINKFLQSSYFSRKMQIAQWDSPLSGEESNFCRLKVLDYFTILEKYNLEFGFRTMDEAIRYTQVVKEFTTENEELIEETIDEQIVQKFITKLNGSKTKMDALLKELFKLSYGSEWGKELKLEDIKASKKLAAFKLHQMITRVNQDQFVSFI